MKSKNLKKELLGNDILLIESEISYSHIEKLKKELDNQGIESIVIKMHNITGGSFSKSFEVAGILSTAEKKITMICSGSINLTGIMPLFARIDMEKIVIDNAKFIIDIPDYYKNHVETENKGNFKKFIKELLERSTLLSFVEITSLMHLPVAYSPDEFIELGILDDNFSSLTENKTEKDITYWIIKREEIFERRNQRDILKYEGHLSEILTRLN